MSNADVLWPIQTALHSLLSEALGCGVYDEVPEPAPFPYVEIGEGTSVPEGAHDTFGSRSTITIHVWSAYRGYREALGIATDVIGLLDEQEISIEGHHAVLVSLEQVSTMRDPQPGVRHAILRFAFVTEVTLTSP